jgi:hypothetical protein
MLVIIWKAFAFFMLIIITQGVFTLLLHLFLLFQYLLIQVKVKKIQLIFIPIIRIID